MEKVRRESIALAAGGHVRGWCWHLGFRKDVFRDDTVNHVGCTYVEMRTRGGGCGCGMRPGGASQKGWW